MARRFNPAQPPLPTLVQLAFPNDANGQVRQCAWCRRILDSAGRFRIRSDVIIAEASHGCCSRCAEALAPTAASL